MDGSVNYCIIGAQGSERQILLFCSPRQTLDYSCHIHMFMEEWH